MAVAGQPEPAAQLSVDPPCGVPRRLILVCTGNTCRSPLAAAIAARLFAERGLAVAVTSAGLAALAGQPAAEPGRRVAARRGLSLDDHRARRVEDVRDTPEALWLAMTGDQAESLRRRLGPGAEARVATLLGYARRLGADLPDGDAIADPVGQDEDAYEDVARTLERALVAIADRWQAMLAATGDAGGPPVPEGAQASLRTKTVALPRLAGLRPTLESTALKLMEEAGELAERIGKYRALSGERQAHPPEDVMRGIGQELLDVAQTAITMMFVLEEQHDVDIQGLLQEHVRKLAAKGYLEPASGQGQERR
jgi:protein-tyrosine-phosphatase/NTP pyrophosphatase (non-canonical NTP hydrolase)